MDIYNGYPFLMEIIMDVGKSTLWEFKYAPKTFDEYICSDEVKKLITEFKAMGEVPTLLLTGIQGSGKTTFAKLVSNELDMEMLYINGSCENSIDIIRDKVMQFATSHSFMGGKKLIVIDEADRLSGGRGASSGSNPAQDALKVIVEEVESNARFIFCTNNPQNIIAPLKSRCRIIEFVNEKNQSIMVQSFKRMVHILTQENVPFDKATIAEYVKMVYPDMRKLINGIQLYYQMNGKIDAGILKNVDGASLTTLIEAMKVKKFETIVSISQTIDPTIIYSDDFYNMLVEHVTPECIPSIVLCLNDFDYRNSMVTNKELGTVACIISVIKEIKWK